VLTRSDGKSGSGRGAHIGWVSALGLLAVSAGLVVSQTSGFPAPAADPAQAPAAYGDATQLPFVVAPQVRFDTAPSTPPPTDQPVDQPSEQPVEQPPRPAAAAGVPVRLIVPKLGVDAPVTGIFAPGGILVPPSDPQQLGWWSSGAMPGDALGGALITGHTVHTGGGAFDDLETLGVGDRLTVRTTGGVLRYAVTGVSVYRKATLAEDAQQVFSQTVPGRLVLVTCEDWNGSTYLSNAVVLATPVRDL
jgi:LPXTG-site transpeptidase (sortase) family protein